MLEIAEFALPVKWQKAMVEHDFDCLQKMIDQIVNFAERQETMESLERGYSEGDTHPAKKPRRRRSKPLRINIRAVYLIVPSPLWRQGAMHLTVVTIQKQPAIFMDQGIGQTTVRCSRTKLIAGKPLGLHSILALTTTTISLGQSVPTVTIDYSKEEVNKIVDLAMKKAVAKAMGKKASSISSGATPQEINKFGEIKIDSDINSDTDFTKV